MILRICHQKQPNMIKGERDQQRERVYKYINTPVYGRRVENERDYKVRLTIKWCLYQRLKEQLLTQEKSCLINNKVQPIKEYIDKPV